MMCCACEAHSFVIPAGPILKIPVDRRETVRVHAFCYLDGIRAPLAELVDALDSKSSSERSAGSIPAWGTNHRWYSPDKSIASML